MPNPYTRRIPRKFIKTITFDGTTGNGATGTVAIATITGAVMWMEGYVRCKTTLVGSSATIKFGTTNNTDVLVPLTTATNIAATQFWQDATPETECSPLIVNQGLDGNLILTIATANITAGVLEIVFYWLPGSDDGNVA